MLQETIQDAGCQVSNASINMIVNFNLYFLREIIYFRQSIDLTSHIIYFSGVMNYQKPPPGNPFFNDDEPGITCNCWQECARVEYAVEVAPNMLR